jgi:hypothetical protein
VQRTGTLAPLGRLKLPTSRSRDSGFSLVVGSCSSLSTSFHGLRTHRFRRFSMTSGHMLTISTGRISTWIFRSNQPGIPSGFRWSPAPNLRVQRTRSSPSARHSPLTRHPLGGARESHASVCERLESCSQLPEEGNA